MILNAIIHTTLITWLAALLMPLVTPQRRMLLACFVAFLFALPIGYENTLLGLNSSFYFVILFGIAAVVAFAAARAFSCVGSAVWPLRYSATCLSRRARPPFWSLPSSSACSWRRTSESCALGSLPPSSSWRASA